MEVYQIACLLGVPGILAAIYGMLWRELKSRNKKDAALENGVQAMLRSEIIRSYYHYSERGWITLHGLEALELAYNAYHDLGGNGTVTKIMNDIRELDVRDGAKEEKHGKQWLKAAGIRAIKTVAQAAVGAIGSTAIITQVDWRIVVGTAAMAGVLSLLTSIAGLPEVEA